MSLKEHLRKYIEKKTQDAEMRESGGHPSAASFHRPAYHRHFDGYSEIKYTDPHGHIHINRIYTGKYYEPAIPFKTRIEIRILYVFLIIVGISLFLFSSTRNSFCNSAMYVNIFQAISIPLFIWLIYIMIFYIPATGKMTLGDYDTIHQPLIRSAFCSFICICGSAFMSVISFFQHFDQTGYGTDMLCAFGMLISCIPFFIIFYLESHLEYRVVKSGNETPSDSSDIT